MTNYKRFAAILAAALLLTGCAQNPESSVIVRKDMENVIREAQETGEQKVDAAQLQTAGAQRYTADFENESFRVRVHADAELDVPETDRLSLLRVKQRRFTQADCDNVRAALMGDVPLCDAVQVNQIVPRARLEEGLSGARQNLVQEQQKFADDPAYAEAMLQAAKENGIADSAEAYFAEMQQKINDLQAEYESAPVTVDYSAYPHDGQLVHNADMIAQEQDAQHGFWHSYCRDMPDGDTLWVISQDAKSLLHVQNSDNYSNTVMFSRSPAGYCNLGSYLIELPPLDTLSEGAANLDVIEGETCTLSLADAQAQAETVLRAIGAEDFVCCAETECSYPEMLQVLASTNGAEDSHSYARPCRVLRYCRAVGGVPIEQNSGTKAAEGSERDAYKQKYWPAEMIEFRINDSGIIRFQWNAPLEITEKVVDNAAMKPFAEIADIFSSMMPMTAANSVPEARTAVTIDRVTLNYSRISEKDSFDTGLIVPIWAFIGKRYTDTDDGYVFDKENFTGVQMALNAIDGSVIVADLGY